MHNEKSLISTLEQSLRETRNAQNRLLGRLREVESEAESLRTEIGAMEKSAEQTKLAILSLLASSERGGKEWNLDQPSQQQQISHQQQYKDDDYELAQDLERQNRQNISNLNDNSQNSYRNNRVSYINNSRKPTVRQNIEPLSTRFADRTITQACTLLLRESNEPLHVNELHNLLVRGGFIFRGNNPTISIAVSLNRNRRFRKVAPGTFDLIIREAAS